MKKVLLVTANYYPKISQKLIQSAIDELNKNFTIKKLMAPGVFEIPVQISKNINSFDALSLLVV